MHCWGQRSCRGQLGSTRGQIAQKCPMATKFGGKNLWPKCNAFLGSGVSWGQPEVKLPRNALSNLVGRTHDQSMNALLGSKVMKGSARVNQRSNYFSPRALVMCLFKRTTYEALGAIFFFSETARNCYNKFANTTKGTILIAYMCKGNKVSLAKEWNNQAFWRTKQIYIITSVLLVAMVMISVNKRMGIFSPRSG